MWPWPGGIERSTASRASEAEEARESAGGGYQRSKRRGGGGGADEDEHVADDDNDPASCVRQRCLMARSERLQKALDGSRTTSRTARRV